MMRYTDSKNSTEYIYHVPNVTYDYSTVMEIETLGNSAFDEHNCPRQVMIYPDYTQIPSVYVTLILVYILVIITAIFGNLLVIWTVWRNTHMHTVTNYYIVNLALSDLLVSVFVMPLKLMEYTTPCHWGIFSSDALCAFLYYILPIFVFTSIFTLVAISIERYYAIVHPLSAMKVNSKSRTRKIIAATWIIPIIVTIPYLFCQSQAVTISSHYGTIRRQYCTDRFNDLDGGTGLFRKWYFTLIFITMYLIPVVVIIVTCVRITICLLQPIIIEQLQQGSRDNKRRHEINKRKVARMVIVVAVAFILSWSPQFFVSLVSQHQKKSFLHDSNFFFTMLMTHLFGFINSCINPFIYTAMSEKFRKSFRRTLKRLFCYFYCRQRYRGESIFYRRPTGLTSATRSFLDPEEEPLQHCKMKDVSDKRLSSGSDSSSKIDQRVLYSAERESLFIDKCKNDKTESGLARTRETLTARINHSELRSDSDYVSADKITTSESAGDLTDKIAAKNSPASSSHITSRLKTSSDPEASATIIVHPRVHFSSRERIIESLHE